MEISKYFDEKALVNIIAMNPKIITGNNISITKEYSINGGRIDLLFFDELNKNHYTIIEVKIDANKIRTGVGQIIEYKEKFLKTLKDPSQAKIDCVVCAPCPSPFEFPAGITHIDLSENVEFLKGVVEVLYSKMDIICKTLNSPLNLSPQFKKEEMKMAKVTTEKILTILKKIDLKTTIKTELMSLLAKNLNIGRNQALNKLNEVEAQGYIKFTNIGHRTYTSITEKGKLF